MALVELEDGNGYIVEANLPFVAPVDDDARDGGENVEVGGGELLEKLDGSELVESVSPEERDVGEVYFRVVHQGGLLVRVAPSLDAEPLSEHNLKSATADNSNGSSTKNDDRSSIGSSSIWNKMVSAETPVVLLAGSTFRGIEVLRPAGSDATFVQLRDPDG